MAAAAKRTVRYNDIVFDNVPSFDHLAKKDRKRALAQHRDWEGGLLTEPDGTLHYSLSGRSCGAGLPRQTAAHLIVKYCHRWHTSLNDLLGSITKANGNISDPNLMKSRAGDCTAVVNLLALDNETLWRLYCSIPVDCRPPERPKIERDPNAPPRKLKRRIRFDGTIVMPKRHKPAPAVPVPFVREVQVCWACCDICEKWRRIPGKEENLPDRWACIDHPAGDVTCETPQEDMDQDEKWDGEMHGRPEPTPEELAEMAAGEESSESDDESDVPSSAQGSTSHPASQGPSEEGMESDDDAGVDECDLWGSDEE